jgi:hypothetical protein
MKTPQRSNVPICYIGDSILMTSTGVWTYLILPPVSWAFLAETENEQQVTSAAGAYANLRVPAADQPKLSALWDAAKTAKLAPISELHIRTAARRYSAQAWARQLAAPGARTPGCAAHMRRVLQVIADKEYWEKITYLGVRLGSRGRVAGSTGILSRPGEEEIRRWAGLARAAGMTLGASELKAVPATAAQLAWLIRHTTCGPSLDLAPLPDLKAYGPEDVSALMDAAVTEQRASIGITARGKQESCATVLTYSRFPKVMDYPDNGPPWAVMADWAATPAFPAEYSARICLMDPQQVDKDIRHKLISIDEEAGHTADAGARVPLALQERVSDAQLLQHALAVSGDPLAYATHRLVISGPDQETCAERARTVIEYCNRTGIKLVRQQCDQMPLYNETIPGGAPRGKLHIQQQPVTTIAGGMPQAAETLGDGTGPYLGTAKTQAETPVFWSPFEAARRDDPTVAAILGEPGGGKSFMTGRICLDAAVTQGATVVILDPIKKEMRQLAPLIKEAGLPVSVIAIDEHHPGLLDPFRFGGSAGEKIQRAAEVLMMLLPDTVGDAEKASRHGAVLRAVEAVAGRPEPSLREVIGELRDEAVRRQGDGTRIEENLVTELTVLSRMPLGSLCFAQGESESLDIMGQTTILTFSGLDLPSVTTAPGNYRMAERLSIALYYLTTELVRGLFAADRAVPKLLAVDEAWALTRTTQGQSLIEAMSRMGRSHNIAMLLASHNVADLLDERITGCISTVLAVHSRADREVRAVFGQLDIADTPGNRNWLGGLRTGEVIMRDLDGRIGVVAIDDGGARFRAGMDTNPTRTREAVTELELERV